jgi:cytochrome b
MIRLHVWDRTTRLFHWINFFCILGLAAVGLMLLSDDALGLKGDAKIAVKQLHVYIGYVFAANLLWRIAWGFIGPRYSRWAQILPFSHAYREELLLYLRALREHQPRPYAGHNPLGRLMVTLLFALLLLQAGTGLVLAGTDLYVGPFGHEIAEWVTQSGEQHEKLAGLKPGSKEGVDEAAYAEMRAFRKPIVTVHEFSFFVLLAAILLHVLAVVVAELREKNGLVSAMISGEKVFEHPPVDR